MTAAQDETVQPMSLEQVIKHFNSGIQEAEKFLCMARARHLQHEQSLSLDLLLYNASRAKQFAIENDDEEHANLFLGFECAIGAVRSELQMYVLLKRDQANEAWDRLVAAQMGCLDAMRAHKGFSNCAKRLAELEALEQKLFPPQAFLSAGFVSTRLDCSICGQPASKCNHLRGRPYMGRICEYIHHEPRGDHVALVEIPADKRCRIVSTKTKDGHRDKMSWELTALKESEQFNENGPLEASSIFLALDRYPYLAPTEKVLGPLAPV